MKKYFLLLLLPLFLISCNGENIQSSDIVLNKQQEQLQKEAVSQVWMPNIINFQEKKLAKIIFELRDKSDLKTYTYITAQQTWKLVFLCDSIWYWLPYSTQYTNPEKIVEYRGTSWWWNVTVPQADPNWLFMPEWLSATWVMCLDEKWEAKPVYIENEIIVSPIRF